MKKLEIEPSLTRRTLVTGALLSLLPLKALARFAKTPPAQTWDPAFELAIDIELDQPEGRRYRRPYVAIWIEDSSGNPVRTISLWRQIARNGTRWAPSLKRWMRGERRRQAEDGGDLLDTVSTATRMAGKYTVVWDGKNDAGKYVALGDYAVCIEVAREHGTYQLIRKAYRFAKKPFQDPLAGNVEVKSAGVEYRKRG